VGLWLFFQWFPQEARVPWPIVNNETFDVTAWQVWFTGGMVIGYHRSWIWRHLARLPRPPTVLVLLGLARFLVALRLSAGAPLAGLGGPAGGPGALDLLFGKETVRPGRIVAFAVFFPLLYLLLTYAWAPLSRFLGWLCVPFGQNALYVYA